MSRTVGRRWRPHVRRNEATASPGSDILGFRRSGAPRADPPSTPSKIPGALPRPIARSSETQLATCNEKTRPGTAEQRPILRLEGGPITGKGPSLVRVSGSLGAFVIFVQRSNESYRFSRSRRHLTFLWYRCPSGEWSHRLIRSIDKSRTSRWPCRTSEQRTLTDTVEERKALDCHR